MADTNQFGSGGPGDAQTCARCEALLMDALDHTASPEDQAFFDQHLAGCVTCSRMYMDAQRGAAWLEMLRDPRPEPQATLLDRILSQTIGAAGANGAAGQTSGIAPQPAVAAQISTPIAARPVLSAQVLPFRPRPAAYTFGQRMLQPRLAMTAAMAFFSIALTLNLTGVRVSELRAGDLRPANLRRGFYQANARVVRYYDNLRVVYELEARVHELQRTGDADTDGAAPQNQTAPKKQEDEQKPPRKPGPGTSLREPLFPDHRSVATLSRPFPTTPPDALSRLSEQAPQIEQARQIQGDRT